MSDAHIKHIFLLPVNDYWTWVQAAKEYAVKYKITLTPRPENALTYNAPKQVISLVDARGAYGDVTEDVVEWFGERDPSISLDIIPAATPHQLRQILNERISSDQRFGYNNILFSQEDKPITLRWPTDYPVIVQGFGENPDLYRHKGLPGHEGIDIRAPFNSPVYACANGLVYYVHDGRGGHPYGIHVRIHHDNGFKTIYANLNQAKVYSGQVVVAGETIGLSGSTGNGTGTSMHLALKQAGATASGLTPFPNDMIDPQPYLVQPERSRLESADWPFGQQLLGLNARIGGPMEPSDWNILVQAGVEALRFRSDSPTAIVSKAKAVNPDMFLVVHLHTAFSGRAVSAAQFVTQVKLDVRRFYEQGVRWFEVHSQPNLTEQGYGISWRDGSEFGLWFLEVLSLLRPEFPEARFGWPGLSVGATVSGMRFDHNAFISMAQGAIGQADWIACHTHWTNDAEMFSRDLGLSHLDYLDYWADKPLLITAFSNVSTAVPAETKGAQYVHYLSYLNKIGGVGAAFGMVASASYGYEHDVWRDENGPNAIVAQLAARKG